jgi:AcrR family transcriptional regulator
LSDTLTTPPAETLVAKAGARRPSIRQTQKQQTKKRLLEAAIELFHSDGYQETTIDQIVRKAGTSRPTFYAHFRDKIDLANDIGATLQPLMVPLFAELDQTPRPTVADVRRWLDAMIAFRREHRVSIEAATDASLNAQVTAHYTELLVANADLYMPNYIARFPEAERDAVRGRLVLLLLQLDRYLFLTEIRGAAFPLPNMLDLNAEIWWNSLFRDLPAA